MRVLIDNQLPATLARWLETKGCVAEHVLEIGLGQATDEALWGYAANVSAAIISKDEDFARLSTLRSESVAVVWIRIGNCRTSELLKAFDGSWTRIVEQLEAGAKLVEVL